MRHFCTAGPVKTDIHYCLPPVERMGFDVLETQPCLSVRALGTTGTSSYLMALADQLNVRGLYRALYFSVESAQVARDIADARNTVLSVLTSEARAALKDPAPEKLWAEASYDCSDKTFQAVLDGWAASSPRPICLLVDEVDVLAGSIGPAIVTQLASGRAKVVFAVKDGAGRSSSIPGESLRLPDFGQDEIRRLYQLHTTETGQRFEDDVFPLVWQLTKGQPWLVNALAYEACFRDKTGRDRTQPITAEMIENAKESLILRRDTHLDQLADKLTEDRVRRVVQPILDGEDQFETAGYNDDTQYVIDLGLVRRTEGRLEISNAIYREVIPRELSYMTQLAFGSHQETAWYVGPDGRLQMAKLLEAFQQFYRENAEPWLERFLYKESGPHLLLQAFLQRIVNGGGRIDREYGLGRRRTDLLVIWKYAGGMQRTVIEIKMIRGSLEKTLKEGLAQTADYMRRVGTPDGHLVIFDPNTAGPPDTRIFRREEQHDGQAITVWGM